MLTKLTQRDKIAAYWNVWKIIILVDGLLRVLGWFIFPTIAYPLRKVWCWMVKVPVLKYIGYIFWIFLGDPETGYDPGTEEESFRNLGIWPDKKIRSWIPLWFNKWILNCYWNAWRNPAWNAYLLSFFSIPEGPANPVHVVRSTIYFYNKNISATKALVMKRAKFFYVNEDGSHSPSTNEGEYVDWQASIFGESLAFFKKGKKWFYAKSRCQITKLHRDGSFTIREANTGAFSRILIRNKWQHAKSITNTIL